MAQQDFATGGFLGKLGELVGYNINSRRYVRRYVIPANPQTPVQQANRAVFAHATALAQQAYNFNRGADYWQVPGKNEFNLRVSTAVRRLKAGMDDAHATPIYPDGYGSSTPLVGGSAVWEDDEDTVTISGLTPLMDTDRVFTVTWYFRISGTGAWATETDTIYIDAGNPVDIVLSWTSYSQFPSGSWVEAATSDDASHALNSYYLDRMYITQPSVPTIRA